MAQKDYVFALDILNEHIFMNANVNKSDNI